MLEKKADRRRCIQSIIDALEEAVNALEEEYTSASAGPSTPPTCSSNLSHSADWPVQPTKHRKRKTNASQRMTHNQMKKRRGSKGMLSGMSSLSESPESSSDSDDSGDITSYSDDLYS